MNKKIKSVKLAKDYRTPFCETKAGAVLERNVSNPEYFLLNSQTVQGVKYATTSFFERDMLDCKTGLFEIEYEDEHFEYIEFPKTGLHDYYKSFLNALADWCDKKYINKGEDYYAVYSNSYNDINITYSNIDICYIGLKFDSYESAQLFIAELNREQNKAVKEYFINLLKSERLI